jgi:hypothetical protein
MPDGVGVDRWIEILHRLLGDDLDTDPEEIRQYWTRPEVQLVIAALTGRCGGEQRMLAADDAGRLQVVPAAGPGVGELIELKVTTLSAALPNNASEIVELTPPAGYYGWVRLDCVYAPAPSGATSGTHRVFVLLPGVSEYLARYEWAYNSGARISSGVPVGSSASYPAAAQHIAGCAWYPSTSTYPAQVQYTNLTGVSQTGTRLYVATCRWIRSAGIS